MKKCPFCAEEIQQDALKCKHCGEFFNSTSRQKPPTSMLRLYKCLGKGKDTKTLFGDAIYNKLHVGAISEDDARTKFEQIIAKKGWKDWQIAKIELVAPYGRFSCPKCTLRYTSSTKEYGCLFIVFCFVSVGIALIAIPFLPSHCKCHLCGYAWKS